MLHNSKLFWDRRITFFLLLFLLTTNLFSQNNKLTKNGGICFRIDDNHPIEKYLEYAGIFNKYDFNFTFALNLGKSQFESQDYIDGVRTIQNSGHELLDHTPQHRVHYFSTNLPTSYYNNHPGVSRINDNRIELKHSPPIILDAKRNGIVSIHKDTVISASGDFAQFQKKDCYLYFPSLNVLGFVNYYSGWSGWIDDSTVVIRDFWGNPIDLGTHNNIKYYNFDYDHIHMTVEALKALSQETLRLAEHYNLTRPYTVIQPGGYHPHIYRNEIKQAMSTDLGYKSAGVFANPSIKVFNEYDPDNDKRFGMDWGDFQLYKKTLHEVKEKIANKIAKHQVEIGSSHFGNLLNDDWNAYMNRVDSLLAWCKKNNIPIHTYTEWANILYSQTPNPEENIFPPLNIDLDQNGIPDGYDNFNKLFLDKSDAAPNANYSLKVNSTGNICTVNELGGVEKGGNNFSIWTKGAPGNFITVSFSIGNYTFEEFKFPAENSTWTKYDLSQSINGNTKLNIPERYSIINVKIICSDYSSGEVKVSGMKLYKTSVQEKYLSISPNNLTANYLGDNTSFFISSNTNWQVNENIEWLSVNTTYGSKDDTLKINVLRNNSLENREGKIYVFNDYDTSVVTIKQSGIPLVSITTSVDTVGAGIINGSGEYVLGDTVKLIATPNDGWRFISWNEDSTVISNDSIYIFTALSSRNLIAKFKSILTGIQNLNKSSLIFNLFQNYPNPFNPTTTIKFELAQKSFVQLTIFSLVGEKIKTLVNKELNTGFYKVKFNGTNLSSGIYLYRIKTKHFSKTRKLILLK